jgi:hypothetical protein
MPTPPSSPAATVLKAYGGEHKVTENSAFIRRVPIASIRKADNCEELVGELLREKQGTGSVPR